MDELEFTKREIEKFKSKKIVSKKRTTWTPNDILIYKDKAEIVLRDNKQNIRGIAVIDKKDLELIRKYKWCLHKKGYPSTGYNKTSIDMHRILLKSPKGIVDHISRDKLDNRRQNLRIVTPKENTENRSKVEERNQIILKIK